VEEAGRGVQEVRKARSKKIEGKLALSTVEVKKEKNLRILGL
jgi:hypothetical protein